MLRVTPLDVPSYRGFHIGYAVGLHGYLAAWRSSLEDHWHEGCLYVDAVNEIEKLAHECIDFNYRVEAEEAAIERKLTANEVGKMI
jgi:hypothetical protein